MKLININQSSIKKLDNRELNSLHRRIHQLAGLKRKYYINLKKVHDIVVKEMIKRGLKHKSDLKEGNMKKSELKILAMAVVVESKNTSNKKKKLLNYIKEEATPYQCMGFILDQKLYNLNNSGEKEIKKRFVKEQSTRKTVHSVVGATVGAAAGLLAFPAYRAIRALFSQCTRACGVLGINTAKRQYCLISCKVKTKQKEIIELSKSVHLCNQTNDPEKCKRNIQKRIIKSKQQLQELTKKLISSRQKMIEKGKDTTKGDEVNPDQTKII